ncbi:MAG: MlaD family protein [Gemmatimonadetes bacterium]|nr:MlaD family protein [Gemmatimonadota bacterium]
MDLYYKQEVKVGALVMAAVVVFFVGLSWLTGRSLGAGAVASVPVRFEDVSGLQVGDPVLLSGVDVGRVAQIRLQGAASVLVQLEIRRSVMPRVDAVVKLAALDFFGAQMVDYNPGRSSQMLPPGQEIIGRKEVPVTETAASLADQAAEVLTGFQSIASQRTADQLHETLDAAQDALAAMTRMGNADIIDEATAALRALRSVGERLDSVMADSSIDRSISQLDEITEGIRETTEAMAVAMEALGSILTQIDSGQGSLGRMVTDTTLAHDMHEVLVSMRRLLDDIRERPSRYINIGVF